MALTDNLVSYWKLEDTTPTVGSITLTNNNSVAFSAAKIGNGADSGTSNSNKSLSSTSTDITGAQVKAGHSISVWIYIKTLNLTQFYIWFNAYDAAGRRQSGIFVNSSNKLCYQGFGKSGAASIDINGTTTLSANTWYYATATYNGTTFSLYLNGNLEGTTDATYADAFSASAQTRILDQGGTSYASGIADEVGIWSRALTTTEITTLYNGGAGLQYPFSTGSSKFFQLF